MEKAKPYMIIGGYFALHLESFMRKKSATYLFYDEGEPIEQYIDAMTLRLKNVLNKSKPEHLIVELQGLLEPFGAERLATGLIRKAFDKLIKMIQDHIAPGKLFVIKTTIPAYYVMPDGGLRPLPEEWKAPKGLTALNQYEKKLAEECEGILLDATKYYFFRKREGYRLNNWVYEEACYFDVSRKITRYIREGKLSTTANPGKSLERYIQFADRTPYRDALTVFLDPSNLADALTLAAPTAYVQEHTDELIEAKKIKASNLESRKGKPTIVEKWRRLVRQKFEEDPDFIRTLRGFQQIEDEVTEQEEMPVCKSMFRNGIVSTGTLEKIRAYAATAGLAHPSQVTKQNAGYYYARMIGRNKQAGEFLPADAQILPPMIDAAGSVLSEIALSEIYAGNKSLSVKNRIRLDRGPETAADPAPWLLLDVLDLFKKYITLKPVKEVQEVFLLSEAGKPVVVEKLDTEAIWKEAKETLDSVIPRFRETYQDQIILLDTFVSDAMMGDDHVLYASRVKHALELDILCRRAFLYLREQLQCYTIEYTHEFCYEDAGYFDDATGMPFYGAAYYQQVFRNICTILADKPAQKQVSTYDMQVRLQRMADLAEFNDAALVREFFPQPLDAAVLSLPARMIRRYADTIAAWYAGQAGSAEELMENWTQYMPEELHTLLLQVKTADYTKLPEMPDSYIPEPYMGKISRYDNIRFPYAPKLYMRDEIYETADTVNALLQTEESAFAFICVTDIHYRGFLVGNWKPCEITYERMVANMRELLKHIDCRFVINLGDDTEGKYHSVGEYLEVSRFVQEGMLSLNKTYYRALGNHDTNSCRIDWDDKTYTYGTRVDAKTMSQAYLSHIPFYEGVHFNPDSFGTEYYVDYPESGIRLIVLNTQFYDKFTYSRSTGPWLRDDALQTENLVLLCEHLAPVHSMNMNADPLANRASVIDALKNFKGTIIQICGHCHCDYSFTALDPDYSPWLTIFSNIQRCSRRRQWDLGESETGTTYGFTGTIECPARVPETASEDCWDVVVVRPEAGKINFVRFGAGEDREFSFPPRSRN